MGKERIDALSFAPDGSTLAIVPVGPNVRLFDVTQNRPRNESLMADPEYARAAVFSKDGARIYTVGDRGEVIEWETASGQRIATLTRMSDGAAALAMSPDGKVLAIGDYSGRITLWDRDQARPAAAPLIAHTNIIRRLAFSPDGAMLASGADDGAAILWDVPSRQTIAQFRHGVTVMSGDNSARTPRSVNQLSFRADGKVLAADGPENHILLWDIDLASWKREACRRTSRSLTGEEWLRFVSDNRTYEETCPAGTPR